MAKIIEAVARITAEDKTGAVFDKIAKKIESIAKSAKSSKDVDALSKALARATANGGDRSLRVRPGRLRRRPNALPGSAGRR